MMEYHFKILALAIICLVLAYACGLIVPPDAQKALLIGIGILVAAELYRLGNDERE